jgi:putative thioredoxin
MTAGSTPKPPTSNGPTTQIDVLDADFDREVLEQSHTRPVAVDFWAPWCGPCRTLGPTLERLVAERGGEVLLAKVDIDQCPETAARFSVRSVPTVAGVRDGHVVASFVGAQPESAVRAFLDQLVPSEADRLVAEAAELAEAGHRNAAEERLRCALEKAPRHGSAWLGLAAVLEESGDLAAALAALDEIDPAQPERPAADRRAAALRVRMGGVGGADAGAATDGDAAGESLEALATRVAAAPTEVALQLELGAALAAAGRHEEALQTLLEAVRLDPDHADGAARRRFLDLLEVLGPEHPLTADYRRRLAGVLFR